MEPEPEFVTFKAWDSYAKRIERAQMKAHGRSLTFSGIARRAERHIIEIQTDRGGLLARPGWREAMQTEPFTPTKEDPQ